MNLEEYVQWTERTCASLGDKKIDNLHMILGIVTEAGELADIFKKNTAYRKEIDWINVQEELGDILFYMAAFCRINKLDFDRILETNINKLRVRYPEKFSEDHANNRDLQKEREILEK